MKKINVAIDGTSGVGKSSAADILAARNGMTHLDTGAMYRCAALAMDQANTDLEDDAALQALLHELDIQFVEDKVFLNGVDVTMAIRTNSISNLTSRISAIPVVRRAMEKMQQAVTASGGWIVDGRDICTVILPDAEVKIFMSAKPEARAKRRYDEYMEKGVPADYDQILADIKARDWNDSHRSESPLVKAADAVEIDTSDLDLLQVTDRIQELIDKAKE